MVRSGTRSFARRAVFARGFTLLELMVVLLIIGLLMSVAAFNFIGTADTGRAKTTAMSMKTVEGALKQYYLEAGSFPPSLTNLVPKYMEELPKDAWKRDFVYFPNTTDTSKYTLYSTGKSGEQGNEDNIDQVKAKQLLGN